MYSSSLHSVPQLSPIINIWLLSHPVVSLWVYWCFSNVGALHQGLQQGSSSPPMGLDRYIACTYYYSTMQFNCPKFPYIICINISHLAHIFCNNFFSLYSFALFPVACEWNPWSCVICGWVLPVCGRHVHVFKHVGIHVHTSIGKLTVFRIFSRSLYLTHWVKFSQWTHSPLMQTILATQLTLGILFLPFEFWNYRQATISIWHLHGFCRFELKVFCMCMESVLTTELSPALSI